MAALSVNVKGSADTPDITFQPGDNPQGSEPLRVSADSIVARFIDTDNVPQILTPAASPAPIPACGNTDAYTATINWGDGSATDTGTVDCDGSNQSQYAVYSDNAHSYADSGTYHISVTIDDQPDGATSPHDTDTGSTATASVSDVSISTRSASNVTGTEGNNVTATATFMDNVESSTFFDSALTATVNWGDGSSSAGTVSAPSDRNSCECNVLVTAGHTYDASTTKYNVSVTLNDDGGSTKAETLTATIGDAALTAGTAKSFTSTATQASSNVVASFTDAAGAQAAAADFTATIHWGDNTTSSGTITKTSAGTFNVSGTHTYATAGTKSLTITVTDEEGQAVTMSATATVPALPATGHPQGSGWPLLPAALIMLGLIGMSAGLLRMRLARR